MKKVIYSLALALVGTFVQAQVKIGANPNTIESASALEVEATNGNKTTINKTTGQITIKDGSQGVDKVLISDANGIASWQAAKSQTTNTFLAATGGNLQQINVGDQVLTFTSETLDEGNNFNPATSTFTVPENGVYYINVYVVVSGYPQYQRGRIGMGTTLQINGVGTTILSGGIAPTDEWGYTGGGTLVRLTAGQQVRIVFGVAQGATTGQQRTLEPYRHLEIMKMSN